MRLETSETQRRVHAVDRPGGMDRLDSAAGKRPWEVRMRSGFIARVGTAVVLLAVLCVVVGCSASRRTSSRSSLLQAENIDLIQRADMADNQAREAALAQDRTLVELQKERHRIAQLDQNLTAAEQRAIHGDQALVELQRSRNDNVENAKRLREINARIERLQTLAARQKPCVPTPAPQPQMQRRESPHVDAFAQDVRGNLRSANISLPVEVRTTRDGQRRVAVVLENAFPPGKDSLTYNMDAVRAVVGLGQLISTSYPGSRVSVDGHTDSDPPRKCPFPSNEALSRARAESVRDLLIKAGVSGSIEVTGQGARYPIASGNTSRAKAQNRRVEIFIEPST